ncbi:MAG: pre-peptidase C-terminal domain-containing protein [Myxococcales bacterium]
MPRLLRVGFSLCTLALTALCACSGQVSSERPDDDEFVPVIRGGEVTPALHHDESAPLLLMPVAPRSTERVEHEVKRLPRNFNTAKAPDPALQAAAVGPLVPTTSTNFDGVGQAFSGPSGAFTVNSAPPDTNGDVGPNHYVQIVNSDFAVFNKTGTPLFGPVPINTLWSGFGGGCQTNNDGDPVVVYDPIANRWVISQFSVTGANGGTIPFLQCVAVSQTADPTGSYFRYSFPYTGFNDYPKMGVWPDGYYTTFNMFNAAGTAFQGAKVCAYDRAKMLTGAAATQVCFNTSTAFGGLLPADLDGSRLPAAGTPNYVVALGSTANTLAFWKFHVDFATPASSTFTGPSTLATAAFSEACAGGTCIPQSGTTTQLDSLADRLMFRLAYRNFPDHEALVVNHSITAGSSTGVRWYELRVVNGTPSIFQQGTYAPDASFRWMGSIAMDQSGNMGLGFSVSSSTLHPSIRYTGRLVNDAAGTMPQGEGSIIAGPGSQTGTLTRWGDYSMMAVDPSDDCTFWFTTEYLPANGSFNWKTRIGSFKFPSCGPQAANDFSISASPASLTLAQNASGSSTISTAVVTGVAETVSLSVSGTPAGATATLTPTAVTAGGSSTLTVNTGTAAAGTYTLTVTGTSPSISHSTTVTLTVQGPPPPPDFSVAISPASNTVAAGGTAAYTVTTGALNGSTQSISLSVSGLPAGVTGAFSPATVTAGASSTLTLTAASTAAATTATFTVTGTSGTVSHGASASVTVTAANGDTQLQNGVALTNLSGATNSQRFFFIAVPAGQSSLTVQISGGTGDADLYVRFGAHPTTATFDCRPFINGNSETCSFTNPAAGNWFIMLNGFSAYSGVTLRATFAADTTTPLSNNVPVTNISGASGSQQFWKLTVPAGQTQVVFNISGGSGDADLYVRRGARPTTATFDCRPFITGNNETCTFTNPVAADYFVMIRGFAAFSGVTLVGHFP